jgi:phosphoglycerate dehydrogenase-like enzyme
MSASSRGVVVATFPRFDLDDAGSAGILRDAGLEIRLAPKIGPRSTEDVRTLLAGATAAIVSTDPFDQSVFDACRELCVVARVGVGLDSIDVTAATNSGVFVTTTPGAIEETVADHTLAMMLGAVRRIVETDASVRRAEWNRGGALTGWDLHGRTVGLVGAGAIGRTVARRLSGFDVRLLAYDVAPRAVDRIEFVTLDELLRRAEIVSVHVPLLESTRGLIGERELALMRPDAILVNTSRGEVVDEAALAGALAAGRLRAAALDVFEAEPPAGSPFLELPNTTLSPHVAGLSDASMQRMLELASESVVAVLRGEVPATAVNPDAAGRRAAAQSL